MAIVEITVKKAQEVDALLGIVADLITKAKAGETILQIGSEELGPLVTALGNIGQVSAELAADPQTVAETVGSKIGTIVAALIK